MRSAEQIAVLKETFVEWLQMHGLDTDVTVYSRSEWEKHEGEGRLLAAAELVFVFENDLVRILHYNDDVRVSHRVEAELQELAEGFGYYFQQPALLLGIAVEIFVKMGENSIFVWEWNPECRDSLWKNRLFKN